LNKLKYLFTLIFLSSGISFSQNIQLNLTVGDTYSQISHTSSITSQDIHGLASESKTSFGGEMSYKVMDKNETSYNIEVKFMSIFLTMNSESEELSASSDNTDTDNIFGRMLKEMTNSSFRITMTKSGRVTKVEMGSFYDHILDSFDDLPELVKHRMIYQLKQSFGEKALKGSIEMITAIFPEEPVGVSKKWTNEIRLEALMGSDMKNTYQLTEFNEDYAIIELNSQTKTDENNSFIKINGELTRLTMNGTMKSTIKIDSKTGWIINSNMIQDFTGLQETKRNEDSTLVLKIPFSYKSNLNVVSD
jgi:hypothetical protein